MTGGELKALRIEWNMTQKKFGEHFGYTAETIAHMERGRARITTSLAKHIHAECEVLRLLSMTCELGYQLSKERLRNDQRRIAANTGGVGIYAG